MNAAAEFDVFVSYNSLDHAAVERIGRALQQRGLTVFLDRWELVPGRSWPDTLEGHLARCRAAAVVLGPRGMGPWQQREHYLALDRQARSSSFGVIPLILPGADPALSFLSLNTWVDLRRGVDDAEALDLLAAAVRGEPPSAPLERTRKEAAQVCPYRGLEVFREEDAPFFFGREAFTEKLRAAVARQPLVAVVGASGSGKSSVVCAGLVPELRRPGGEGVWEVVTMLPGREPLQALAVGLLPFLEPEMTETGRLVEINKQARYLASGDLNLHQVVERVLAKQKGTGRLLLVVDQWEELYTHHAADEQAEAERKRNVACFIDALLTATQAAPLTVVLTLRADFYGEALTHRALADRLENALVNLGPMSRDELERAVIAPVEKVGLRFDDGLADRLLDDVGDEPGNLPLMEFALKALWETPRGNRLLHSAYQDMGGVKGAVAKRAEDLYARLDPQAQTSAQKVFTLLVRPGDEIGDTRRRARLDELDDAEQTLVRTLSGKDARLLVTGRDAVTDRETVEVAHEALLREWPRLKTWIAERREALRLRDHVVEEAHLWVQEGRPDAQRWKHERLDPVRRSLTEAGILAAMERNTDTADFLTPEADWLLAELLCSGTGPGRRETIGTRLSAIGDPRPGVDVVDGVPDILWCPVPAGEVEIRDHGRFRVRPFHIAAYPVTYAQYRAFLDAEDGYRSDRWWHDLRREAQPGRQLRPDGSYPADRVSWSDAMAFCRWLSDRLGFEVRLPDEREWQWAAQSARETFAYPWGPGWLEDAANTLEAGIGRTTAVGMYLNGRSAQGAYDLAGNVWEWCRNEYAEPRRTQPGGDASRALRGGSWNDDQDYARSAYRYRRSPDYRNYIIGFRVLCSSPIDEH